MIVDSCSLNLENHICSAILDIHKQALSEKPNWDIEHTGIHFVRKKLR